MLLLALLGCTAIWMMGVCAHIRTFRIACMSLQARAAGICQNLSANDDCHHHLLHTGAIPVMAATVMAAAQQSEERCRQMSAAEAVEEGFETEVRPVDVFVHEPHKGRDPRPPHR